MSECSDIFDIIANDCKTWLITGCAGFIGSNILEVLLKNNQFVVGLDNLSTGYITNLHNIKNFVTDKQWARFRFIEGDIRNESDCDNAMFWGVSRPVEYVLHQAALGSVPRSIDNPLDTNNVNITGFLNMLVAARKSKVKNFIYAASSSTYGDIEDSPKVETSIGNPLSPYAVTKYVNELYAGVFHKVYGFNSIGLRYFNVFGPRQNINGVYAAVIPKWISQVINEESVIINGDGSTSRDFCYIENVVQANLRAALTNNTDSLNQVYNIAHGEKTSLNTLLRAIVSEVSNSIKIRSPDVLVQDFRSGDVRHSLADISKAQKLLGYMPLFNVADGLKKTILWYLDNNKIF